MPTGVLNCRTRIQEAKEKAKEFLVSYGVPVEVAEPASLSAELVRMISGSCGMVTAMP